MSQAVSTVENRSTDSPAEEVLHTESEISEMLAALDDPDCRSVLEATGEDSLSAKEIVERCEIPSSTAYRKIEQLIDVGLLREQIRVRSSGNHTREYRRSVDHVGLSLGDDGSELRVVRRPDA
ncbi:winged helix-turn-helix domain-containing protein [Halolamina salifodinae]|uniref:Response regulator of citrate/malate metabolism n=1 Tax=Halolamina salifodinae TaxID=1202767 RepID=A0A8T4H0A8_9EURY|nr:helix-turn-helix domain-containing protein [Halolamina salifodinae]MBP1987025.1 response regulator of citrate/malate metabolism [Halolamina salifodinae]